MKVHINNTLLDIARKEEKINHYEYNFVLNIIDTDRLATFGLSEKQEEKMAIIYPKLYEGTIYSEQDEEQTPAQASTHSNYDYKYSYEYTPDPDEPT